jgi:hypothetical protein
MLEYVLGDPIHKGASNSIRRERLLMPTIAGPGRVARKASQRLLSAYAQHRQAGCSEGSLAHSYVAVTALKMGFVSIS